MPKVTIILPSYNVRDYIQQCMNSVTEQTLREIEILCVDAGSTDGTEGILQEFAARDDRIRILESDRKSYGYQMNMGIKEARGEYIGIVETDDFIEPDMYEILYRVAKQHDADIVKGGRYERFGQKNARDIEFLVDYVPADKETNTVFSPDDDPSVHWWEGNIWDGIYRRELLMKKTIDFNESPGAAYQDIGFFHLSMNEADRVVYLRNPFYHYRKTRPGASSSDLRCFENTCKEYRRLLECGRMKESRIRSVYRLMIASILNEYEKTLYYLDFERNKMDLQAINWFEETVRLAMREGILRMEDLPEDVRRRLTQFLIDRESFDRSLRRSIEKLSVWKKELLAQVAGRKLILFGAGNYGTMIFHFLVRNGITPDGFTDNNIGYRNLTMWGLPVWSPDEASVRYREHCFLICGRKTSERMKKQLLDWGVPEKQIMVFSGEDRDVVEAMRKLPILLSDDNS